MLIDVITFEIRDFATGQSSDYVMKNSAESYELIASHRSTRNIEFDQMFEFEFERKMRIPNYIRDIYELQSHAREYELDDIDEMVGVY